MPSSNHAIVIGVGPGLGAALVERCAREGMKVTAGARDRGRLRALLDERGLKNVPSVPCDVSDPASVGDLFSDAIKASAARATCAPGRGSAHGMLWTPCSTANRMRLCQAGWNSTSSRRCPNRSCVWSTGGYSLAWTPHSIASADPAMRPYSANKEQAQPAPSRATASRNTRSVVNRLKSASGGA